MLLDLHESLHCGVEIEQYLPTRSRSFVDPENTAAFAEISRAPEKPPPIATTATRYLAFAYSTLTKSSGFLSASSVHLSAASPIYLLRPSCKGNLGPADYRNVNVNGTMAMRSSSLLSSRFIRPLTIGKQCVRCFHKHATTPSVPSPTPFVPDVQTFLTLIGRGMSKHASKLPSWEKLFTLSSTELRDLGIEPSRQRRYLLRKREKFRNGVYGPGGDLEFVVDGTAQLRVVEVPLEAKDSVKGNEISKTSATLSPGMKKVVVNLQPDASEYTHDASKPLKKFAHMKIHRGSMIMGPFLQPIKGTDNRAALIKVQEGMWEDKLGHKVDGGERRRAEVRAKKRSEERRKGTA